MTTGNISTEKLANFWFDGKNQDVAFVETLKVTNYVTCDVYVFKNDKTKDLGIINIEPGKKTPLQRVLNGDKTIEGYISGRGKLTVTKPTGDKQVYLAGVKPNVKLQIPIKIGELMQWEADGGAVLTVYEVCFPPYKDGRYENIT